MARTSNPHEATLKAWETRGRRQEGGGSSPTAARADFARGTPGEPVTWSPKGGWPSTDQAAVGNSIRDERLERGGAWSADGTFLGGYTSNDPKRVVTPSDIFRAASDGGHMMHCHPPQADGGGGGSAQSPADLASAVWARLGSTTVVTRLDGQAATYRLEGLNKLSPSAHESGVLADRMEARLKDLVNEADRATSLAFGRGRWGQRPSQNFGFAVTVHLAHRRLAKEFRYTYSATWRGVINSDTGEIGTLDDALRLAGIE